MFWLPLPLWFAKRLNFSNKGRLICYSLEFLTLCRKSAYKHFTPLFCKTHCGYHDMLTANKYGGQHFAGNCCVRTEISQFLFTFLDI